MGTDIHGVFQRFDGTAWQDVPSKFAFERHYQLFAVLAGVRNGYGFAGVATGEAVKPMAEPRGLPRDFASDGCDTHPSDLGEICMGDHSHSWLTADEMLNWAATAPKVVKIGVLSRADYAAWDGKSKPQSYCGDAWGQGILVINDNAVEQANSPAWTHVRCTWEVALTEELAYFFNEVRRLVAEHGQVRFVFGFDS